MDDLSVEATPLSKMYTVFPPNSKSATNAMRINQNLKHGFTAILLASGQGERFGGRVPKQFIKLKNGKTMLETSLEKILPFAIEVIVTLPLGKRSPVELTQQNVITITGGATRQQSVLKALEKVRSDYLFIHDAARPFVHRDDIDQLLKNTTEHGASILAKRATDTIKQSSRGKYIKRTLRRDQIWLAETPQAFRTDIYTAASMHSAREYTDDAALVEATGQRVHITESQHPNPKITKPEDLIYLD